MIYLNIFLIIWSLSAQSFAGITIVSDLDDTIKISNSGSTIGAPINALKKTKVFAGIPEFFKNTKIYAEKLYILSASPTILHKRIEKSLKEKGIIHNGIILKRWSRFENRYDYKFKEIKNLMEQSSEQFILIGDDIGDDPEVYSEISRFYAGKVLAIYIHVIKNRPIPEDVIPYWLSYELAAREYLEGRMDEDQVQDVLNAVYKEHSFGVIFPSFAHCPQSKNTWNWLELTPFANEVSVMTSRFLSYCSPLLLAN